MFSSTLEKKPDYVNAIGMISIENANMELALAGLFSATLGLKRSVGHAIYLTPKSAQARIEIFQAAVGAELDPSGWDKNPDHQAKLKDARNKVLRIAERALTAVGKRHGIIHDQWGLYDETEDVGRASLARPAKTDGIVDIKELRELIRIIRSIITDAGKLARQAPLTHLPVW